MASDDARHGESKWPSGIAGALSAFAIEVGVIVALLAIAFVFAAVALAVF